MVLRVMTICGNCNVLRSVMTSVTLSRPHAADDGKVSQACKAGTGTAGKLAPQCRHRTHGVQKNTKFKRSSPWIKTLDFY